MYHCAVFLPVWSPVVVTLRLPSLLISIVFPFLCALFAKRMYGSVEAVFAFILGALPPVFLVGISGLAWGNYAENIVFSALLLLLAHEIAFKTDKADTRRRMLLFMLFGLIAGLGWWAHPSIILPFAVGCFFIFLEDKLVFLRLRFYICIAMFFMGSLPLWLFNLQNGFVTLRLLTESKDHFQLHNLVTLFTKMIPAALGAAQFVSVKYFSWADLIPYISKIHLLLLAGLLLLFLIIKFRKLCGILTLNVTRSEGSAMLIVYWILFSYIFSTTEYGTWKDALRYLAPLMITVFMILSVSLSWIWRRSRLLSAALLLFLVGLKRRGTFLRAFRKPYCCRCAGVRDNPG